MNPSERIKRLRSALDRAKKLKKSDRFTSAPMAELLGVRWPALRAWCDEIEGFDQSGAFVRGGNGIEWEFDPRKTISFLIAHFEGLIERQAKESRRITKAVGVTLADDEAAPSLAETKDLVNLTLAVTAAQEKQGFYTPAHEVAAFIEGYNETVVSGILGTRTKVDPNGNLPVAVRKALDEHLRSLASAVHAQALKFIEVQCAGAEPRGVGRAG